MNSKIPVNFFDNSCPIVFLAGDINSVSLGLARSLSDKQMRFLILTRGTLEFPEQFLGEGSCVLLSQAELPHVTRADYVIYFDEGLGSADFKDIALFVDFAALHSCRFMFVTSLYSGRDLANQILEYSKERGVNCRIAALGDIYDLHSGFVNGYLSKILTPALRGETVVIPYHSVLVYPVSLEETVAGLERVLFSSGTGGFRISLVGAAVDLISTMQQFKLFRGELNFEFGEERIEFYHPESDGYLLARDVISWFPQVSLPLLVDSILPSPAALGVTSDVVNVQPVNNNVNGNLSDFWKRTTKERGKQWKLGARFLSLGMIFVVFWFLALPVFQFAIGLVSLNKAFGGDKTEQILGWSDRAHGWFQDSRNGIGRLSLIPGVGFLVRDLMFSSDLLSRNALIERELAASFVLAEKIAEGVVGGLPFPLQGYSEELVANQSKLISQIGFLEAELGKEEEGNISFLNNFYRDLTELSSLKVHISSVQEVLRYLPDLLGAEGKRKYLVLLYNNHELRPSGGVVSAFGILTFDRGRLINTEVYDVAFADDRLQGFVAAPTLLREHLKLSNWSLRDSSWNPDFAQSARQAVWFIDKELGESVDGVLGLDLIALGEILELTGPVELSDLGVDITKDNLSDMSFKMGDSPFFKDLLTQLFSNLTNQESQLLIPAVGVLGDAFEARHAALWVQDAGAARALTRAKWDGALVEAMCVSDSLFACFSDSIYLFEANLSANRVNNFIEKEYSLDLTVQQEYLGHSLTVVLQNDSGNDWPGGDYKNYLSVLVPSNATNIQVHELASSGRVGSAVEFDLTQSGGRLQIGFLNFVPASASRTFLVSWDVPFAFSPTGKILFSWQKQFGNTDTPLLLRVSLPEGVYNFSGNPLPTLTTTTGVSYNTGLSTDMIFDFRWQQIQ